jgi:hypothetical protein
MLCVREGLAAPQLGHVAFDPLTLARNFLRIIPTCFLHHMVTYYAGKRRPRPRQRLRQAIDFAVKPVADNQSLICIEHRQAARHVVEGNVKPTVELI